MARNKLVLSASRRTDLTAWYPNALANKLNNDAKFAPDNVHTIVLWTKDPTNLVKHEYLKSTLERYSQLYIQLTVTGIADTKWKELLEPRIKPAKEVADVMPEVLELLKHPSEDDLTMACQRVTLRFDPLVNFITEKGEMITNYEEFERIVKLFPHVKRYATSFCIVYGKVAKRLAARKLRLVSDIEKQKRLQLKHLFGIAKKHKLDLKCCCEAGQANRACIDGKLLNELHPLDWKCSERVAPTRELCTCTKSTEIGKWYGEQMCPGNCLYCYAQPTAEKVEDEKPMRRKRLEEFF